MSASKAIVLFREIYADDVLERLVRAEPTEELTGRRNVLNAAEAVPAANDESWEAHLSRKKHSWATQILSAAELGLLDPPEGADLRARLRSPRTSDFRGALGECRAAHFLSHELGLTLSPRPSGRRGKLLDFALCTEPESIYCEVKAPYRDRPRQFFAGNDADLIQRALEQANRQLADGRTNLLVLAPSLRIEAVAARHQLVDALLGAWVIKIPIDVRRSPARPGAARQEFETSGHFLETRLPSGRPYKPGGEPRFTRVGGVLCIEELSPGGHVILQAVLVHNPYAQRAIPEELWQGIPQLVVRDKGMYWTDRRPDGDDEA